MIRIEKGVDICNLSPQMAVAVAVLQSAFRETLSAALTITSGRDGNHRHVLHYVGQALDFRIHNLTTSDMDRVEGLCQGLLGEQYDVVLENDHLHVEFDPRQ